METSFFQPIPFSKIAPPKRAEEIRLGEKIQQWQGEKIPAGSFALLGAPDDRGVAHSKGRVGAKEGPMALRKELYRMTLGVQGELDNIVLWDLGDLKLAATQIETYDRLRGVVRELLESQIFPILIGGGHDLSFGSLSGFLEVYPKGGVINCDPHLDCRLPESEGNYSSGTPFRHLLDENKLKGAQLVEFGFQAQSNSKPHWAYLKERRAHLIGWDELSKTDIPSRFQQVFDKLAQGSQGVALTFDLDSIDVSHAPGVSAINAFGLTVRDALGILQVAASQTQLKYLDLMELNPACDVDARTARLAALLLFNFLKHRRTS